MGHHYVPQKYLQTFADPNRPGFIWQFDKKSARFSDDSVSIKKVAQQREFYDPDVEMKLNELVERPGNAAMDKLRSNITISDEDRVHLSVYIATMLKRVPRHRDRGFKAVPQVLTDVISELREQIKAYADAGKLDQSLVAKRLAETDAAEDKFRKVPPPEVIVQIRTPWPSDEIVRLVFGMHWRFLRADGPSFFLTSDNPAFFFECYGLGNPASELTFPLSHDLALLGSWTTVWRSNELVADQRLVREANRRIASAASRFVFYREKADWVAKIASKSNPYLSRIQW